MNPPYTTRQGQFLAFIQHYTTIHGRPPAEAELVEFFRVTPPSVHSMILNLERRRLITRTPGQARSIRLNLPPEQLLPLSGNTIRADRSPPASRAEDPPLTVLETSVSSPGKAQLDNLFAHNDRNPIDDSEFLPLLDVIIESFAEAGQSAVVVKQLRRRACELYDRCCRQKAPNSTREANLELMFGFLPAAKRKPWREAVRGVPR
jgi:LexA DNA binding domain